MWDVLKVQPSHCSTAGLPACHIQIEESGLARDAAHGQPPEEQPLGVGDAYLDLVGVGRHAHLLLEQPGEVERA
jgi:hypothetical protein